MKRNPLTVVWSVLIALPIIAVGGSASAVPLRGGDSPEARAKMVRALFESMRQGTFKQHGFDFPAVTWADIPVLLEIGQNVNKLKNYPTNPISSYAQSDLSEGMLALWLIEGVRKGRKFASLNPLCLPEERVPGKWEVLSEGNHPQVLKAYRKWWEQVREMPEDKARQVEPLKGTKLRWY